MTPERVAQIENLPDAVRKVMLAMRGHLDCRPQFQLLFNAIDDLLAERRQIEEATTKRRRELSGIIRDWQKFAARLGEMLDCVAITDGIEKAVKKVLAERREREKDSRLTERIRNLLPFVDDASLDRFENEIKAGEHIAELEASLREREKQQAKLENDLANAAAVAMTYGPDALDNIGPNDGKLTTVSGEGERIAQLEAQKVELEQRRNETVAMCTQLQAELATLKAQNARMSNALHGVQQLLMGKVTDEAGVMGMVANAQSDFESADKWLRERDEHIHAKILDEVAELKALLAGGH